MVDFLEEKEAVLILKYRRFALHSAITETGIICYPRKKIVMDQLKGNIVLKVSSRFILLLFILFPFRKAVFITIYTFNDQLGKGIYRVQVCPFCRGIGMEIVKIRIVNTQVEYLQRQKNQRYLF